MSCSVTLYQPGSAGALDPGEGTRGRIIQLVTITIYFIHPNGKIKLSSNLTKKNISQ